jgi:hypothetical protein
MRYFSCIWKLCAESDGFWGGRLRVFVLAEIGVSLREFHVGQGELVVFLDGGLKTLGGGGVFSGAGFIEAVVVFAQGGYGSGGRLKACSWGSFSKLFDTSRFSRIWPARRSTAAKISLSPAASSLRVTTWQRLRS